MAEKSIYHNLNAVIVGCQLTHLRMLPNLCDISGQHALFLLQTGGFSFSFFLFILLCCCTHKHGYPSRVLFFLSLFLSLSHIHIHIQWSSLSLQLRLFCYRLLLPWLMLTPTLMPLPSGVMVMIDCLLMTTGPPTPLTHTLLLGLNVTAPTNETVVVAGSNATITVSKCGIYKTNKAGVVYQWMVF